MRRVWCLAVLAVLVGSGVATAQTPGVLYSFGVRNDPAYVFSGGGWRVFESLYLGEPSFNRATYLDGSGTQLAGSAGLVVTEIGSGTVETATASTGVLGGPVQIVEATNFTRDTASVQGTPYNEKGCLDTMGLQYLELDIKNNLPSGTVPVDFNVTAQETQTVVVSSGPSVPVGNSITTLRFPLNLLTPRQQTSVKEYYVSIPSHVAQGNLTWTISQVRTVGTPLIKRDIVTNNLGSPDHGLDGVNVLANVKAILGNNNNAATQVGFSRADASTTPVPGSASGSLQWTDKGGDGTAGHESGVTIGWGNGAGFLYVQPGTSTSSGNNFNQRIADFSNYNRMTVRISATDSVNPAGTVGIQGLFLSDDPNTSSGPPPIPAYPEGQRYLTAQNLTTDGLYHDLVYDLSSVEYLKNVFQWGLIVPVHPNNIVFNIDNIQMWRTDYNQNGTWDAADYVLWRKNPANYLGNPDGYDVWRQHFGESSPGASGSGSLASGAVPEPSAAMLLLTAIVGWWWKRRGV